MDTDEELARRLQEEFNKDIENNEEDDEDFKLALKLQEEFNKESAVPKLDVDAEIAKSLQEEFDTEDNKPTIDPAPLVPPPPINQLTFTSPPISWISSKHHVTTPVSTAQPLTAVSVPAWTPYQGEGHMSKEKPQPGAIKRLKSDLQAFSKLVNPTIFVEMNENDFMSVDALIIGPEDTPYEGGFFHFQMKFPPTYPWKPPVVTLMTTDYGRCRFNPNLYANGKVCLSILGTWSGPGWTPIQTCLSTLQSIQTLMNPTPYHNEPGCERERVGGEVSNYNDCIMHETIRVAVCGMVELPTCGEKFKDIIEEEFLKRYDKYVAVCQKNLSKDDKRMNDPFGEERGKFGYSDLLIRLQLLYDRLSTKRTSTTTSSSTSTSTNDIIV